MRVSPMTENSNASDDGIVPNHSSPQWMPMFISKVFFHTFLYFQRLSRSVTICLRAWAHWMARWRYSLGESGAERKKHTTPSWIDRPGVPPCSLKHWWDIKIIWFIKSKYSWGGSAVRRWRADSSLPTSIHKDVNEGILRESKALTSLSLPINRFRIWSNCMLTGV